MARRTKEDAEKTRESLLDAAEILFLRKGVSATTLEEIAREAGLTRGAVYWHFDNKMALFQAMVARAREPFELMYEHMFANEGENLVESMKRLCFDMLIALEKDVHMRNVYTVVRLRCEQLNCNDNDYAKDISAKRQLALSRFTKVFKWAEERNMLAPGITPELAAITLHAFFTGVHIDYLREPKNFKLSKMAPQLVDICWRGLLK